ncbi:MAG TPA: FAD-dependent oxidoreductase [Polyangiaceae bacterium]|nr:FAD-dependent oxidoreductase [Polyangiaceae bacterium]
MPRNKLALGTGIALSLIAVLGVLLLSQSRQGSVQPKPIVSTETPIPEWDVIVVGSGIAGLSAAYELGIGGADVLVTDMASVFGGHAVMATGDLCLVGTPYQEAHGIKDTPDLAYQDFVAWGEDPDLDWVRYYVNHSKEEIYDWVTGMGVTFETFATPAGNSVKRTHRTKGRGIGLVTPVFQECARRSNISFRLNTKTDRLLTRDGRVVGVATTNTRTLEQQELYADAVILATGGFQSNLDMVREAWPKNAPFPPRFLIGSGINSMGSGHKIAHEIGADLVRMDHQWNYITGLPDPRFPGSERGLNALNPDSVWVNAEGKRFIAEKTSAKFGFPILMKQKGATYWSIFAENTKHSFWIAGSDWSSFDAIEKQIFSNPALVKSASTIEELADKVGLPKAQLRATIDHYNEMVERGVDDEFGRFGPDKPFKPKPVLEPPFYAVQFFPLTRKSMGGVAIDTSGHVVDGNKRVIPGLYAAGELTGLAGINGKAGLEGTFIGPSIITGRVAGRSALADLNARRPAPEPQSLPQKAAAPTGESAPSNGESTVAQCMTCHQLPDLISKPRPGYWHFEKVHNVVLSRQYDCMKCHAELGPSYDAAHHHIDHLGQSLVCPTCHSGEDR